MCFPRAYEDGLTWFKIGENNGKHVLLPLFQDACVQLFKEPLSPP